MVNLIEMVPAIFGLVQGVLILMKRKENWIFYLLNISTLIIYSLSVHLYGDVIENLIYLIIGLFGTLVWANTSFAKRFGFANIRHSTWKENVLFIILIVLLSAVIYIAVSCTDDPLPILDSVTTGMGFVATYMMATKIIETWIVWFIDDILMVITYESLPDPGHFLVALNLIWIFMAIISYISWKKEITNENV